MISDASIEVESSAETYWIFADKPANLGIVVSGAIVRFHRNLQKSKLLHIFTLSEPPSLPIAMRRRRLDSHLGKRNADKRRRRHTYLPTINLGQYF